MIVKMIGNLFSLNVALLIVTTFIGSSAPPLEYMANLHSKHEEISGRQVWTGSLTLAHALLELSDDEKRRLLENKRILELGSGTGILGMAISKICSKYLPAALVLTDGDETAVDLLKANLANPVNRINASVRATQLLWGVIDRNSIRCPEFFDWCRANFSGWSNDGTTVVFDAIFAGDVLYKAELPKLFFETAFALLSKNDGSSLWLCHIPRHGVSHEMVVEAAMKSGFSIGNPIDMSFVSAVRGCPVEDIQRAIIHRMYVHKSGEGI